MTKTFSAGLIIATSIFASSAYADDTAPKYIVGFGLSAGSASHEITAKANGVSATEEIDDLDSTAVNIHLGLMLKNNNRFLIGLDSLSVKDDAGDKIKAKGLRLDWQFVYGDQLVQPYWGLGFGIYSSKELGEAVDVSSLRGVSFQAMGGVKLAINKQFEIDLNLQAQGISWQNVDYVFSNTTTTLEQSTTNVSFGLGADYKF